MKRASVIVIAHNEGERLWKTVESVLEASIGTPPELIVVDDASTDHSTAELSRLFPRVALIKNKKRAGVSASRALGASRARGDVLVFLDGHTKPERGALTRLASSVRKTHGEAVITPQVVGLDETAWQVKPAQLGNGYALDLETFDCWWLPLRKMTEVKEAGRNFFESPAFIGCAVAISRELYDRLWGFDPHMQQWGGEDLDFALKAWLMGASVLHDPGATVAHRFQRLFHDYSVGPEYPLANQIRTARKHFTESVWEEWLLRAQQQPRRRLQGHAEGLWARAWEVFRQHRQSAEHERAYLLSRRRRDEFWFAKRFERGWPTIGTPASPSALSQPPVPPSALYAAAQASPPPPYPASVTWSSNTENQANSCTSGQAGWIRNVIMQVLDQNGNPYKVANVSLVESFTTVSDGLHITPITANPNPFLTNDQGQYNDSFYCCSPYCPGSAKTTVTQHHTANGNPIADITIVYACTSITIGGQ